jgi:hypothetical protein
MSTPRLSATISGVAFDSRHSRQLCDVIAALGSTLTEHDESVAVNGLTPTFCFA